MIALSGTSTAALAQAVPNVPQSINPGRLPQQLPQAPEQHNAPQLELPAAPEQRGPPAGARELRFTLSDVVIEGVTVYPAGTFRDLYAAKIGQAVTLTDVYSWAQAITRRYRADGFVLSRAVVPRQRISGGVVRLAVVEGFIDNVTIQGSNSRRLAEYGRRLTEQRPLTAAVLERYLLLANQLPGLTVHSVLAASKTVPGAADLTLVATAKEVDGAIEIDNRGTRYLGPWQDTVSLGLNNAFGLDERLVFRYAGVSSWRELNLFDLSGSVPLDDDGVSLIVEATRTRGRPGYTLSPFDPRTTGDALSFSLQDPFILSRAESMVGAVTFSYQDSVTLLHGANGGPVITGSSDDKIRALRASLTYSNADDWGGTNTYTYQVSQGLPTLDSSTNVRPLAPLGGNSQSNPSRVGGRVQFTKVNLEVSRLQSITDKLGLLGALAMQKSFQSLLAPEQFGVGGPQFGRGYDPSEITGDSGMAGKLELQYNQQFLAWQPRLAQFYVFYDAGRITNRVAAAGQPAEATLASAGFGVRVNLGNGWLSNLEFAKPLTRPVAADVGNSSDPKSLRFYFSLAANF